MAAKLPSLIAIIRPATVVPAGVVPLMELQEQGWSYVRP
jgi:intracellular sulfur oxidation DsrE/DsrF family protein